MPRKPKIVFDIDYLSSLDADPSAPRELYLLRESTQKVLSQLAEMVLWRTRWYDEDGLPLADAPPLAYQIYEELKVPYHLDDLIPLVDDLESLVQEVIDKPCCSSLSGNDNTGIGTDPYPVPDDFTVGTGDPPQGFQDNPLADYDSSGTIGWNDYAVYLCDAGHRLAAAMDSWLSILSLGSSLDLFDMGRELVKQYLKYMYPGSYLDELAIAWDAFYDWIDALGSWVTGAPTEQEWDDINDDWNNTVRDQLICHVAQAVSPDTAAADVRSDMQSLFTGAAWDLIWTLYPFGSTLRKVFNGAEAYEGPLACDCVAPLVAGMNRIPLNFVSYGTINADGTCALTVDAIAGENTIRLYGQTTAGCSAYRVQVPIALEYGRDLSAWTVTKAGWQMFVTVADVHTQELVKVISKQFSWETFAGLNGSYHILPDLSNVPWTASDFDPWNLESKSLVSDDAGLLPPGNATWQVEGNSLNQGTFDWTVELYAFVWLEA